jgi:hypothetical protein
VNIFIFSALWRLIKLRTQTVHKAFNSTVARGLPSICTETLFNHVVLNLRDVACVGTEVGGCDLSRFSEQIPSFSGTTTLVYYIIYYWLFVPFGDYVVERPSVFAASFVRLRGPLWLCFRPVRRTRPSARRFWRRKPQLSFVRESMIDQAEK